MSNEKKKERRMFVWISVPAFVVSFVAGVASKLLCKPSWARKYSVALTDEVGTVHRDLAYGEDASNRFDLYLPADGSSARYGLVVYLHAGGFTQGDKSEDEKMLTCLCSKGYVAAGINYTLRTEGNGCSVYSQSMEIKEAVPKVIEEAKKLGYRIDRMAVAGGSAGGTLAMLYAYRDAKDAPVPVKMMFEAVGPSSFS